MVSNREDYLPSKEIKTIYFQWNSVVLIFCNIITRCGCRWHLGRFKLKTHDINWSRALRIETPRASTVAHATPSLFSVPRGKQCDFFDYNDSKNARSCELHTPLWKIIDIFLDIHIKISGKVKNAYKGYTI